MYNWEHEVLTQYNMNKTSGVQKWLEQAYTKQTHIRYSEVESALVLIDLERIAIGCGLRGDTFVLFLLQDGNKERLRTAGRTAFKTLKEDEMLIFAN